METLTIGDRIKVTTKQHPVFIGQAGKVMSVYQFENMDLAYKVRIDNGPICVLRHDGMEVTEVEG